MKTVTPYFLFVLMIFLWGLSWPFNKIGFNYTSPINYIEFRFLFGMITAFIIALVSKNLFIPRLKDLPIILTVGIFQITLMNNLTNYGLSLVPAGRATFLAYTASIWIIPLSAFWYQKVKLLDVFSFCMGIIGVVILIEPWKLQWNRESIFIGDMALLLAAISWAIGILCARHMTWHRSLLQLLPWQLLLATVSTIVFAYFKGINFIPDTIDPVLIWTLIYTGAISISVGYWIMILVSKKLPPAITSLGLLFVPIVSLITSIIYLKEQITTTLILSIAIIMTGALIHIYSDMKSKSTR